ncbi:hypothetical protein ACFVAV_34940 [Nocardia sp. NPDC057663]|uniref:hypothetical protein n=1 Tax=Nocardia sp. NPDC057663 TaxID=3346201 RepID=UPI003670DABB
MDPQEQPYSRQPNFPHQQRVSGQQPVVESIDVSYVCDEHTARRLSRGRALMIWRRPSDVALMAGGVWGLTVGAATILSAVGGVETGAFLIALSAVLPVAGLYFYVMAARVNRGLRAVAGAGHRMSAHYTADAVEIEQTSGRVTLRYSGIKKVVVRGDVVFLQPKGFHLESIYDYGLFLPREIVPDEAVARIRAARG